jgi:Family of unknown function (DUF5684)
MNMLAFLQKAPETTADAVAASGGSSTTGAIIGLFVGVLVLASTWRVFTKAGEPGWASIVPIYNVVVLLRIARKPLWWLALLLIPAVNVVASLLVTIGVAQRFGKGTGFGLGMVLLPFVFLPLLAFGDAEDQGVGGRQATA